MLFATLDVTTHAGRLPNNMQVLFIDTVGFISDIPLTLLDAFAATLEDAILAVSIENNLETNYIIDRNATLIFSFFSK